MAKVKQGEGVSAYAKIMTSEQLVAQMDLALSVKTLYANSAFGAPAGWGNNRDRYANVKGNTEYRRQRILNASDDTFLFDCVCLVKGISAWGWCANLNAQYGGATYISNGVDDYTIDKIKGLCEDWSTDFSNILPGEYIRLNSTHCALYYGDGYTVESTTDGGDGVVKLPLSHRNWEGHGKLPWIDYDTQPTPPEPPTPPQPKIPEDGSWGPLTTFALQELFHCDIIDGAVSRQPKSNRRYLPNCYVDEEHDMSWQFRGWPWYLGGSYVIKALQRHIGADDDGYFGKASVIALQEYLAARGYYAGAIDGSCGPATVSGLQMWINAQ